MATTVRPPRPLTGPEIDDDAARRRFLQMIGAAGLLAGCASDGEGNGTSTPTPTAAATREFTDRLGRTMRVPVDPQRVVVLDPARALVDTLALGIIPVGSTTAASNGGNGFPVLVGAAGAQIASVGEIGGADLERIKGLNPDLILFATVYQENLNLDILSAIAPVIAYERPQFGLLEPLRFFGAALGRGEQAAALERAFVDLIAARRPALGLEGKRVAVINMPGEEAGAGAQILGPNAGFNPVLNLLGATFVPPRYAGEDFTDVSVELLAGELADVDLLIGLSFLLDDAVEPVTTSPIWRTIPAVAAGNVAYLNGQNAFANYGLGGVQAALDQLATQLS